MNSKTTHQSLQSSWKQRATWVAIIAALAILCLTIMPQALLGQAPLGGCEARLQGSWLATVTLGIPNGPPPFEVLTTYIGDGQVIGSQPNSPGWNWTPWHGSWTKTGRREFASTMIAFQSSTSDPSEVYKVVLRETLVIGPDGNTLNSTSSIQEWFGPDGAYEAPVDRGDMVHAVRIHPE